MTNTVRIIDFDAYEEMIEETRERDDDLRFIVGNTAPTRDFSDMVEEWVDFVGYTAVRDFALDRDRHVDPVSEDGETLDVDVDDHVLEDTPSMYHDEPEPQADDGVKRIGDAAFPAYGFADETSTDDLEQADTTLLGTTIYPASELRTYHPAVLTADQMLETLDGLRDEYDPGEHAILVGAFSPVGNFAVMNDGPVHRVGDTTFPADAFVEDSSISGLQTGKHPFFGTVIVEREALSEDAKALLDGDVDEIGPDEQNEEPAKA